MNAPSHQLVGDDIKFREAPCAYCGIVTTVRWFPWNSRNTSVRGWVCLACFRTEEIAEGSTTEGEAPE